MSGTTIGGANATSVQPLSSLAVQTTSPSSSDVLFGSFNGAIQFVQIGALTEVMLGPVNNLVTQATNQANSASSYAQMSFNGAATAINQQKGNPGGVAPLSGNGFIMLNGSEVFGIVNGQLIFRYPLPTVDPGINDAWWNNGGIVTISNGA